MNSRFGLLALTLAGIVCLPVTAGDEKKDASSKETTTASAPEKTDKSTKPKKDGEPTHKKEDNADKKKDKFTATCPVSGSSAKKNQAVAYKGKEIYFCCDKCKAAYEAEPAKFVVKANFQLVQTKQFKQIGCPVSGGKTNKEQVAKIDGVNVAFCCEKCKGAVDTASKDDQMLKVFAEEIFTKAFAAKKDKPESSEDSNTKPSDSPAKKGKKNPDSDKSEKPKGDNAKADKA